ncbi:MAG: hypothetical protein GJU77_08645 [Ferrovum sp.]|jgi:hypothetical protein|nr:hypothetical protein [Ferrovum sp.]NDU90416.1 hypothetical protein [Ferrovum sp.]
MTRFFWLALLFVITRNHAWTPTLHLPDASLAVFFLAGLWLTGPRPFLALLALGAGVDAWAITAGGVSSYCVTPAYALLLPASAALWLAGRFLQGSRLTGRAGWLQTVFLTAVATLVAELFSSGGFYFLSGRFVHPFLAGFLPRLLHYSPAVIGATVCYATLGLFIERRCASSWHRLTPSTSPNIVEQS